MWKTWPIDRASVSRHRARERRDDRPVSGNRLAGSPDRRGSWGSPGRNREHTFCRKRQADRYPELQARSLPNTRGVNAHEPFGATLAGAHATLTGWTRWNGGSGGHRSSPAPAPGENVQAAHRKSSRVVADTRTRQTSEKPLHRSCGQRILYLYLLLTH
jgi:hypothetical protein